ncbi:MAG: Methyltransferase type 11 [Hyphomicrobiales bacterium]|nr:Methyltransferase type 11 [Hyphomicrobiales bacterium]
MKDILFKLIPGPIKQSLKARIANTLGGHVSILKYHPEEYGRASFSLPQRYHNEGASDGLPVPPRPFWIGYGNDFGDKGKEWYITKGKRDVDRMLEIVTASGFSLTPGSRVLEMGCAAGRMIRHLNSFSESCEIWGVDVDATLINWCKHNISPPFQFATTTTIPHLPFADSYFDFIYTGSVFTHIDDLAESWLLELRRILSPEGRLYVTIHDRHTIKMLDDGYFYDKTGYFTDKNNKEVHLTTTLNSDATYRSEKDTFGMLVIGRDYGSQVFYDVEYFRKMVVPMYEILSITEEAYGYQTAILLKKVADNHSQAMIETG